MKKFPNVWLSDFELADVMRLFESRGLPDSEWPEVFKQAESKIKTKIQDGQKPDRICAYGWLTDFLLTNALNQWKQKEQLKQTLERTVSRMQ